MRILYTNFHAGDGGGHTTYILNLASALRSRHEVHIAAPPQSRLYREASRLVGVTALAQPFPNGVDKVAQRRAARADLGAYLRAHGFDVVHVNGSADHRLVMSCMADLLPRPRVVMTKHNSKPLDSLGNWWRARFGTDQVIAVCAHTGDRLAESAYRRCPIEVVPNGVDTERFQPWPEEAVLRERRRWVDDPDALLLGSNAGTAPYKGWMDMVEAIASLPAGQRRKVHLVLAGHLPSAEDQARVDALGVRAQVHFTGLVGDVRPILAAVDAGFVLSWGVETVSFACREMMAMGKPVVVSEYAGLAENVADGEDGWVVPPRSPRQVAEVISGMLVRRQALRAMGQAARRRACSDFAIGPFAHRTESIYLRLAEGAETLRVAV